MSDIPIDNGISYSGYKIRSLGCASLSSPTQVWKCLGTNDSGQQFDCLTNRSKIGVLTCTHGPVLADADITQKRRHLNTRLQHSCCNIPALISFGTLLGVISQVFKITATSMISQIFRNLVYYGFPLQLLFVRTLNLRRARSTIRLVLDWDGTLTKRDTLHIVAAIGYDHNQNLGLPSWDNIVQTYISDYTDYEAHYTPTAKERKNVTEESEWLASLKNVERRSIERTEAAGIFTGITKQDIMSASKSAIQNEKLQLRQGWRRLLTIACEPRQQSSPDVPLVSIISVNWSATFIKACIETALAELPISKDIMSSILVFANEVPLRGSETTPAICTSADKLAKFKEVRGTDDCPMVYVGDSPTDFDCLIAADVGICVRDNPMGGGQKELKETLERVGFEVVRLNHAAWEDSRRVIKHKSESSGRSSKKKIWWVESLDEILKFVEDSQ